MKKKKGSSSAGETARAAGIVKTAPFGRTGRQSIETSETFATQPRGDTRGRDREGLNFFSIAAAMIVRLLFRVLLVATALQASGWREVVVDARPAGAVASGAGEAGLGVADTAGVLQRGAPRLLDDLRWDPAQPRRIGKGLRDRRFHPGPGAGSASLARVHSSTHATHAAPAHAGVAYTLVAARAGMISSHTNGLPPPLQG